MRSANRESVLRQYCAVCRHVDMFLGYQEGVWKAHVGCVSRQEAMVH